MSYALLSGGFVAAAAIAGGLMARQARLTKLHWQAMAIAAVALFVLTAIFDNLMISVDLFSYTPELISGIHVGLAPIEDFTYPLAAVIVLPIFWELLNRPQTVPVGQLLRQAFVASRPISWINTAFPFAAAMLLTTREVDWLLVVGTLFFLIPYNLAMYGINDVFDYESDINNPRKGGIEGAVLARSFHRPLLVLIAASSLPFLIVLVAAGSGWLWIALGVSVFAVIAYSAPPFRFKEIPVLDSITSSTHFVSPAVVGFALAGAAFSPTLAMLLIAFFMWGIAAHAFGAVQDIGPDREGGIASIATAFGAKSTVRFSVAFWLAAGVLLLFTPWPGPLAALVAVPYLINCAPYINVSDSESATTNKAWRRFIWLNYFSGFLITLILILHWSTF